VRQKSDPRWWKVTLAFEEAVVKPFFEKTIMNFFPLARLVSEGVLPVIEGNFANEGIESDSPPPPYKP